MDISRYLVHPCGFEQRKRPAQVRFEYRRWAENASIYMRLGGEMDDCVSLGGRNQFVYQRRVTDVALEKTISGIVSYGPQVIQIAGIGQLVEDGHIVMTIGLGSEQQTHESRADEA